VDFFDSVSKNLYNKQKYLILMDNRLDNTTIQYLEYRTKGVYKLKDIFRDELLYHYKPGIFSGAKVLKKIDGIIALVIYIFIGSISLLLLGEINFSQGMEFGGSSLLALFIVLFISPLGISLASTTPLEDGLKIGIRKYPLYLGYIIIFYLLLLILIIAMMFLAFIGLFLGLIIGIGLLFYILYRIFLTPGIIALSKKSIMGAISASFELTKGWKSLGFFIEALIIRGIVLLATNYILSRVTYLDISVVAFVLALSIPLFIIDSSITLLAEHYGRYTLSTKESELSS
jgi:hypothetical protein